MSDVVSCPICRRTFSVQGATDLPFCSRRCRTIDLGRWLGERYAFPVTRQPEDEPQDDLAPPAFEPDC